MPSNGKSYRLHRGRRFKRPWRRVRSADDIRVSRPPSHADLPDEYADRLADLEELPTDDPFTAGVGPATAAGPEEALHEEPHDEPFARPPGVVAGAAGYAIVEPPSPDPSGESPLPPPLESSPGVPPRRPRKPIAQPEPKRRRGLGFIWSLAKWAFGLALLGAVLIVAWSIVSFFIIRMGVNDANERLQPAALAALADPPGSALTTPHTILFLGVDTGGARSDPGRADSVVLMRTDPDTHRISLLSIPRDLRVEVPGRGLDKINAAYAEGGAALTVETVENLTGVPVHHVAIIDFNSFPDVIDAVGGVTIDVPAPIVSNRFDCPYPSQVACDRWDGWRFSGGEQTMSGDRALIYSRVRENRLDASESDITRGERQQAVIRATIDKLVSLQTFARLPFVGRDVTRVLSTDLTTSELFELAWVKFRTPESGIVQCRLGGAPSRIDGVAYLVGTAQNAVVVNMFLGLANPRKPQASAGAFAPGCPVTGEKKKQSASAGVQPATQAFRIEPSPSISVPTTISGSR